MTPHIRRLFDAYGPRRCYWGPDITNSFAKASYRQRVTHFTEELTFLSEEDKDQWDALEWDEDPRLLAAWEEGPFFSAAERSHRRRPDPRNRRDVARTRGPGELQMDHTDHVALIRDGVAGIAGAGTRWLELGAGEGAFTLALADLLGPGGRILATDRNGSALRIAAAAVGRSFRAVELDTRTFDYTDGIPYGPFDGVLAANTLHFVADRDATLRAIRFSLVPGGRLVIALTIGTSRPRSSVNTARTVEAFMP
jgi:SAM-dependent methyltransferase